ncbi:MAG: hypothetical protein JRH20_15215 [Deltaproteobacteria bacterium]|nr:hypothetical protein [Deltaproteobacteria bacterium]
MKTMMTTTRSRILVVTAVLLSLFFSTLDEGRVDGAEPLGPEVLLPAWQGADAYRPAVAYGDGQYLVAWQAGRVMKGDIVACRVDAEGKVKDATPVVISAAADDQEAPSVAFGQGTFLVVWQDLRGGKDYDTYAARVSPEGKVLDPAGILISGGEGNQSSPRVIFDGTSFVVAWEDHRSMKRYEIYAARVSPEGEVLDPEGVLIASHSWLDRFSPALSVTEKPGEVLVGWNGRIYPGVPGDLAGGVRVAAGQEVARFVINGDSKTSPGDRHSPMRLARDGMGHVMVWRNYVPVGRANPAGNANLLHVDAEGVVAKRVTLGSTGITDPDVVWDGEGHVVAWHEQRGKADTVNHTSPFDAVYLRRLDGVEVVVAGTFDAPARRAHLARGADKVAVVYERHPAGAEQPIRVGLRLVQ